MTEVMKPNALAVRIDGEKLGTLAESIKAAFLPLVEQRDTILMQARDIVVHDATEVTLMQKAGDARKALKRIRTTAEAARKKFKDDFLRGGRAIDGIAASVMAPCEAEEDRLAAQEEFAVRVEAARKAKLKAEREKELGQYLGIQTALYDLANMPEDRYQSLLMTSWAEADAKHDAEVKAAKAAERLEAARVAEEAVMKAENERLRKANEIAERNRMLDQEIQAITQQPIIARIGRAGVRRGGTKACLLETLAETRQWILDPLKFGDKVDMAQAAKEAAIVLIAADIKALEAKEKADAAAAALTKKAQAEADAKLLAERQAREKLEQEAAERAAAEKKRLADEEKARKKAAAAPDKQKIFAYADALAAVPVPTVGSEDAQIALDGVRCTLDDLLKGIRYEASTL